MRIYAPLVLFLFSTQSFAIFCPTSFNNIDYGDTIQQVQQICGNPDSVNQYQKTQMTNQVWEYYIQVPGINQNMAKMTVLFRNDQVMNIHLRYNSSTRGQICPILTTQKNAVIPAFCTRPVNDENVASTDMCGSFIQVGNNAQTVQYACGQPAAIKSVPGTENQTVDITEFQYVGPPKGTLIFENGKLSDKLNK